DIGTVAAHLQALASDPAETNNSYRSLSRATALRAGSRGLISQGTLEELLRVLE
ncbi:oxidoreductase, partial [Glutamicibacter halophytocola]|nr:oxidoreductase [Glutamicibacter halophytocola]